jgi:hypothetical protein
MSAAAAGRALNGLRLKSETKMNTAANDGNFRLLVANIDFLPFSLVAACALVLDGINMLERKRRGSQVPNS